MLGFGGMVHAQAAKELERKQRQVVVFLLSGGVSQLETWDPKPNTDNGGPFNSIETSASGVRICELLPHTAKQMHHLALVRGVNTKENNHAKGAYIMQTGHRQTPGFEFPYLGSAFSSLLNPPDSPLPGYICVGRGGSAKEASFLGPRHVPLTLAEGKPPSNLDRHKTLSAEGDLRRRRIRKSLSDRFGRGRRQAETEVYNSSFDRAANLMGRKDIFDFSTFSDAEVAAYGKHDFGRQCLMARKLVESGVTFTKVTHTNYDTHSENFNFHIEQLGEFDQPFATLVADLAARGLLDHTLIVVLSEFGRTPKINARYGRDHWGTAWSVCLGGAGIVRGGVVGETNKNGTAVTKDQCDAGHLFHTYLKALGMSSRKHFKIGGQKIPLADPAFEPIKKLLI